MESARSQGPDKAGNSSVSASWPWMLLALGLPAVLYLGTLYPGPGGRVNVGDSAKFQYIGEILGVPHEPGYPQYVVLNFLWTRLPLPLELADKVNLLSAVLGLLAGGFLFSTVVRLSARPAGAVLATWTVLLAPSVWIFSTEAEIYSLHLLWFTSLLWAVVHLLRCHEGRRRRWLLVAVAILGLSFGNHPTAILLIPGFLVVVLGLDFRLATHPRTLAAVGLIAALSLSQYAFVLWRSHSDAPFLEGIGREASVTDLIGKISGARFSTKHLLKGGSETLVDRLSRAVREVPRQLSWPPVILAILGVWALFPSNRLLLAYLLIGAVGPPLFVSFYQIGDWQAYLAPTFVCVATLASAGLAWSGLSRQRWLQVATALWLAGVAWTAFHTLPAVRIDQNPRDRSDLLAAAEPGDWVVTYPVNGYSFRQLNYYYRYGLRLEETRNIQIRTATEVFEQDFAFLSDDRLLFATQDVRDVFDQHRTDYVPLWSEKTGTLPLAASGTRFPTRTVRVLPDGQGMVSVIGPDELALVRPEAGVQIVVASPSEQRIKGVASFPTRRAPTRHSKWPLRDFLGQIRSQDWVCVVLQGPALARGGEGVRLILDTFQVRPVEALGNPGSLVIAGLRGDNPSRRTVITDPDEPVDLLLPARP